MVRMRRIIFIVVCASSVPLFGLTLLSWCRGLYVDDIAAWNAVATEGHRIHTVTLRAGRVDFSSKIINSSFDGFLTKTKVWERANFTSTGGVAQSPLDAWTPGAEERYDDIIGI